MKICTWLWIYLAIETELREVQQRASELQKKAKFVTEQVDSLFKGKTKTSNIYSSISKLDILDNIRINEDALATVTAKLTSRKSNTNNVKPDQLDSSSSSSVQHSTNVQVQLQPKSIDKVPNVKNFETSSQS